MPVPVTLFDVSETGRQHRHPIGAGGRDGALFVYSKGELDIRGMGDPSTLSRDQVEMQLAGILRNAGGLIVSCRQHDDRADVKVTVHNSQSLHIYDAPSKFAVLQVGSDSFRWVPFKKELAVSDGDRLIVPVDAQSQGELESFQGTLRGFSSDTRAGLINVIRRPSIELRVEELERRLEAFEAAAEGGRAPLPARSSSLTQQLTQKVPSLHALRERAPWWVWASACALLVALGVAGAFFLSRDRPAVAAENEAVIPRADPGHAVAKDPPSEKEPPVEQDSTLVKNSTSGAAAEALKKAEDAELLRAYSNLRAQLEKSRDPTIKTLWKRHWPAKKSSIEEELRTPMVSWGILKLVLLRRGAPQLSELQNTFAYMERNGLAEKTGGADSDWKVPNSSPLGKDIDFLFHIFCYSANQPYLQATKKLHLERSKCGNYPDISEQWKALGNYVSSLNDKTPAR